MKYIVMMNTMKAGSQGFPGWPNKDLQAHIAFMINLDGELHADRSAAHYERPAQRFAVNRFRRSGRGASNV